MRGDVTFTLDVDFGDDSRWGVQRYFDEQLRFFDAYLKEGASNSRLAEELSATTTGARTIEAFGLHRRRLAAGQAALDEFKSTRLATLRLRSVYFPSVETSYAVPTASTPVPSSSASSPPQLSPRPRSWPSPSRPSSWRGSVASTSGAWRSGIRIWFRSRGRRPSRELRALAGSVGGKPAFRLRGSRSRASEERRHRRHRRQKWTASRRAGTPRLDRGPSPESLRLPCGWTGLPLLPKWAAAGESGGSRT